MSSNLPLPGIVDATGVGDTAILPPNSSYLRTVGGDARLVVHDGKTLGGIKHATKPEVDGKPDRYPATPFTAMLAANDRVYNNLVRRFVYPDGNYLWPSVRAQTNLCHQVDPTTPPTAQPDLWAQATIHTPFYERWRLAQDQGDTTTAAAVAAIVTNTWAYTQQKWSLADLKALTVGTAIGFQDDGDHVLKYLKQVIEVTGDATAKAVIQEALAALLTSFLDPRQTGADLYSYPSVTPDGRALQWNQWGVLYPPPNDKGTQAGTGYVSTIYEAKVSHVAGWLSQQSWVSAAYKAALLAYAKNRADFYNTVMRTTGPDGFSKIVAGIHWCSLNLDPNVHSAVDTSFNGGNAATGSYNGVNRYHQPVDQAIYDRVWRGLTGHFPDGTYEVGCTNYWVWRGGGGASYLAEFEHILAVVTDTTAYARDYHGVRVFGVFRDAWVDGQALGDLTRCCRASIKAGNTTTDPTGFFRQVVVNTAKSIAARSVDGYLDADWMGRQYSPAPGRYTSTWIEDNAFNFAGGNGSAFGHPRQLTTNGCAGTVVGAAAGLAGANDPALLNSGVTGSWSIETLAAEVAALTAALETTASLFGGQTFADPFNVKLVNTGFHHDGYSFYMKGDTLVTRFGFNRTAAAWQGVIGSKTVASFSGDGSGTIDNNLTALNGGVSALSNATGGQLYLGMPGGFPGISYGVAGYYSNVSGGHVSHVAGNSEVLRLQPGDAFVYGGLHVAYHITPTQDNNFNVGSPSLRYAGIYLGNSPNVTSDETTKTDVTPFTPDELAAARAIARVLLRFKNIVAVERQQAGGAPARWHSGVLAQDIVRELQTRGLITAPTEGGVATDLPYDWVGYDSWPARPAQPAVAAIAEVSTWEDMLGEDGQPMVLADGSTVQHRVIVSHAVPASPAIPAIEAGELYTVRYEPLLVWIAAAHEAAMSEVEAAIPALAARVSALEAAHS